ncbi:OmpA family protein [Vibrio crassostreae]|uniref:OmpA family protein n=1 Tax=Vibrio crassostreae TaxID=246167 RepID=UPI001199AF86|nr:OmpA family protein [Vibrio crassostreae]TWD40949.1 OmpA family protein [Vibrio crassostreae]
MNNYQLKLSFLLLVFISASLKADYPTFNPIFGIGTFYSAGEQGGLVSLGVEFDSLASGYLDFHGQEKGDRLSLTLDREIPFDWGLSLVGTLGSTIWSNDAKAPSVKFDPVVGVGVSYDWSPFIATSFSYQHVFSDESSFMLEPSLEFVFVFKPFSRRSDQVISKAPEAFPANEPGNRLGDKSTSSCNAGIFMGSIYFTHNSTVADIKSGDITKLQLRVKDSITLIGHTDPTGRGEYNQQLGLKRADFVKKTLINSGNDSLSINVCSEGKKDTESPKGEIAHWKLRRVDVYLDE